MPRRCDRAPLPSPPLPSLLYLPGATCTEACDAPAAGAAAKDVSSEYEEMTIAEIMCGKHVDHCGCGGPSSSKGEFPGLVSLVRAYLDLIQCDAPTRQVASLTLALLCFCFGSLTNHLLCVLHPKGGGPLPVSD